MPSTVNDVVGKVVESNIESALAIGSAVLGVLINWKLKSKFLASPAGFVNATEVQKSVE